LQPWPLTRRTGGADTRPVNGVTTPIALLALATSLLLSGCEESPKSRVWLYLESVAYGSEFCDRTVVLRAEESAIPVIGIIGTQAEVEGWRVTGGADWIKAWKRVQIPVNTHTSGMFTAFAAGGIAIRSSETLFVQEVTYQESLSVNRVWPLLSKAQYLTGGAASIATAGPSVALKVTLSPRFKAWAWNPCKSQTRTAQLSLADLHRGYHLSLTCRELNGQNLSIAIVTGLLIVVGLGLAMYPKIVAWYDVVRRDWMRQQDLWREAALERARRQQELQRQAEEEQRRRQAEYLRQHQREEAIAQLSPQDFERFVAQWFASQGYSVECTPYTADHGVDVRIYKDQQMALVQCKHSPRGRVGRPVLQQLYGEMVAERAHRAYVVTSGVFTAGAREWARDKPLKLIDGRELRDRAAQVADQLIDSQA